MPNITLSFASGEGSLSVRRFSVHEEISRPFQISVMAVSPREDIDLETIVGRPCELSLAPGVRAGRRWTGVCSYMELMLAEPTGLSTYQLQIAPDLWRLTQRTNNRIFQHKTVREIVSAILGEWRIEATWQVAESSTPKLEYRVQYGESDLAFVSRLLEEAGIAYVLADAGDGTKLVFRDEPHHAEPRAGGPIVHVENPTRMLDTDHVTHVRLGHRVRPGALRVRDFDFRNPPFELAADAPGAPAPEDDHEQYHYRPGSFVVVDAEVGGSGTPAADDRGAARASTREGTDLATRWLESERASKRRVSFQSSAADLAPGVVFSIGNHPRADLGPDRHLLVIKSAVEGVNEDNWVISAEATFAEQPFRPARKTPKPRIHGPQSALVVGPANQEIHTDEFGRVRVQFHWDREGRQDDRSSCWMRVSQGWAGAGFGMFVLPRIGQEVLVGFLDGDPDQPIVVGRVFNNTSPVPYKLPENKTVSTWKSHSTPNGDGFNEIKMEDAKDSELVYVQAQKDLRKLVKNNEYEDTGNDRRVTVNGNLKKLVKKDETETTEGSRLIEVGGKREKKVAGEEAIVVSGQQKTKLGGGHDLVIEKHKKEHVLADAHLHVDGDCKVQIDGAASLLVAGDQQEAVGGRFAQEVGGEIHIKGGGTIVIEAATRISLKAGGGFIDIGPAGIAISGTMVKINSGGSAASGSGSSPAAPEDAEEP